MDWFRAHHGISNDIKLTLIATRLNIPRCEVGWIWMILLDAASQNSDDRGNVGSIDADEVAMLAGVTALRVTAVMDAFRSRGMLSEDGRLTSWEKRQPDADPTNADRQKRYRERKKSVTELPLRNALRNTDRTEQIEQNRTEQTHNACAPQIVPKPPKAADLAGPASMRFEDFWEQFPRKQRRGFACSEYLSVVTADNERAVFDCLGRYLASDEVSRGVIQNPDKWLYEQHRGKWAGDWPKARDSPAGGPKLSTLDRLIQESRT